MEDCPSGGSSRDSKDSAAARLLSLAAYSLRAAVAVAVEGWYNSQACCRCHFCRGVAQLSSDGIHQAAGTYRVPDRSGSMRVG